MINFLVTLVIDRKKNKIGDDGILHSSDSDEKVKLKSVDGSFYTEMMDIIRKRLSQKGDWVWLKNGLTHDKLKASEVEPLTKRYRNKIKMQKIKSIEEL